MKRNLLAFTAILALLSLVLAPRASAVQEIQKAEPYIGQPGKDVIWVPTPMNLVEAMLDLAKVTRSDYLVDLGSGDGRIPIAAAKRGLRALGIEYNPDMVAIAREKAKKEGVADRATFWEGDIFESDFSQATVVTMYLLSDLNLRLRPTILDMKPGTRVVSHSFSMGDWEEDARVDVEGGTAYLWIVPAKVEGVWTWKEGLDEAVLTLRQDYQKIEGGLKIGERERQISNAFLEGDRIRFEVNDAAGNRQFSGRVSDRTMKGTATGRNEKSFAWSATGK
jgi:SAM-dependent methyltransferase